MSNKVYQEALYNPEVKSRFLKSIGVADNSASVYATVLRSANAMEEELNKDLYDFNLQEIESFMKYIHATTVRTVATRLNIVKSYITWAIEEGYTAGDFNPLHGLANYEYYIKLIGSVVNVLITEEEMRQLTDDLDTYTDKAIIESLFEGIVGKELSELANLKKADINLRDLEVTLHDQGGAQRKLTFTDDRFLRVLLRACEETVANDRVRDEKRRMVKHQRDRGDTSRPVRPHVIAQRLTDIKARLDGEYDFLTPINLRNSGMVRMARDIYEQTGKLDLEDARTILTRYHISTQYNNVYHYKKTLLNKEAVVELYGERGSEAEEDRQLSR